MTFYRLARTCALTLLVALCFACEEDNNTTAATTGSFQLEMTDAPVDDPDVRGVFVTVADVRVDGQSVSGFSRTTVEVSALTDGATALLASTQLEANAYSSVEIILDGARDEAGNAPGCYVMTADGSKSALEVAGDGALSINSSGFRLEERGDFSAVVDFDLRKAVQRSEGQADEYRFASESRLESSLRFVEKSRTGTLRGSVANNSGEREGEVIIYAYAAGTYQDSEARGDDDELFLNAVSSTRLSGGGDYTLAFLEEGSYDLVAASYQDSDGDGDLELAGRFQLNAGLSILLGGLTVDAQSSTTVDFALTALLP